jgi:DNA-binding transcriptional LysR family regulator
VGQPLFVRGSRAGQLTEAGVLLQEYAERMLNLRDEISRGVEDLQNLDPGAG